MIKYAKRLHSKEYQNEGLSGIKGLFLNLSAMKRAVKTKLEVQDFYCIPVVFLRHVTEMPLVA